MLDRVRIEDIVIVLMACQLTRLTAQGFHYSSLSVLFRALLESPIQHENQR